MDIVTRANVFDTFLPNGLTGLTDIAQADNCKTPFVFGLIQNALTLFFVVIILAAIIYAALAGLKYIQSQGDSSKVEEAAGALKSVLFGVAAVFIGIIGVILITSIFSSTDNRAIKVALAKFVDPVTTSQSPDGYDPTCVDF